MIAAVINKSDQVEKLVKNLFLALVSAFGLVTAAQAAQPEPRFNTIEIARHQSVLLLRINTPPRNAVSKATLGEIDAVLDIAARDTSIGAIVITGTERVFSEGAGGDGLQKPAEGEPTHAYMAREVYSRIEGFPKPVIAAIAGVSAGGGNELAMSCDIRIAGESARFRQHELLAGLMPGFGGMQRLQRLVGLGRAMEIMLTGRFVESKEALDIGLVTSVVPDSAVVAAAINLGQQLSDNLDKHALAKFKERMSVSYSESFSTALRNDQLAFDQLATSEEARAALARFIERQQAGK